MLTSKSILGVASDLAMIVGLILLLFHEILFTSAVLLPGGVWSDMLAQEMGTLRFTGEELAAGRLPLWNPYVFLGYPHLAMGYSGVFYPTNVTYGWGSFPVVYKYDFLAHLFAGAAFMYWLGRRLYTSRAAALCCAAYMIFAGETLLYASLGQMSVIHFTTFVPLGLLCLVSVLRGGSVVWALLWSVVLCVQIFAGYFQLLVYELLVFGIFCGVEILRQFAMPGESKPAALQRAAILLLSTGIGLALGCVQLFPAYELLSSQSVRGRGVSAAFAAFGSFGMLKIMAADLRWESLLEHGRGVHEGFLLGFAALGVLQRRSPLIWAGFVSAVFAFIFMIGHDTPASEYLMKIPVVGSMRGMMRMVLMLTITMIFLAGFGIDGLLDAGAPRRKLWLAVACLLFVMLGAIPVLNGFSLVTMPFTFYLVVCALFFVALFSPAIPRSVLVVAVSGAVMFDVSGAIHGRLPAHGDPSAYDVSKDWLRISEQHKGHDRFLVLPGIWNGLTTLNPQIGSLARERTVNGYGGLELARYTEFFARSVGVPRVNWTKDGYYDGNATLPEPWLTSAHQVEGLGAFNVKYYVAAQPGAPLMDALAQHTNSVRRFVMDEVVIYENRLASSPAYILHQAAYDPANAGRFNTGLEALRIVEKVYETTRLYETSFQPLEESAGQTGYPYNIAILDEDIPLEFGEPSREERAEIVSYLPTRVEISLDVDAPGVLVFTDMFYPGWHCTINGNRAERVFSVNGAARGVQVRPGDTTAVFTYAPASFRNGVTLAFVGTIAWIGWSALALVWPYRRRLRRVGLSGDAAQGPAGDPQDPILGEA